jgi:hypothetical protein
MYIVLKNPPLFPYSTTDISQTRGWWVTDSTDRPAVVVPPVVLATGMARCVVSHQIRRQNDSIPFVVDDVEELTVQLFLDGVEMTDLIWGQTDKLLELVCSVDDERVARWDLGVVGNPQDVLAQYPGLHFLYQGGDGEPGHPHLQDGSALRSFGLFERGDGFVYQMFQIHRVIYYYVTLHTLPTLSTYKERFR